MADDDIKGSIDGADKVVPIGKGKRQGGKRKPEDGQKTPGAGGLYGVLGGKLCLMREGEPHPLCNFTAAIVEEVLHDNGDEAETSFAIDGALSTGEVLPRIEVQAAAFESLGWVSGRWGARAYRNAGTSMKDHLRCAIQKLSGPIARRTIYGFTGWKTIDGEWRYLHTGGALGADGNRTGIEVDPGRGHMSLYRLPDPPEGQALADAVKASLRLAELAPKKPELGIFLLAAVYRAPTAAAAAIDHGGWLLGSTGTFKSETGALAQAHSGGFTSRALPANWHDSESDLELKAYAAKDALFLVDDFKPVGGAAEINRLHAKADRLFRSVGNQSGRGRRNANLQQRAACHPRGFVLSTGEDLPRGQSVRARMTVVDLAKGEVDRRILTELQQAAASGLFALAMAGYVRWLSGRMDELKASLPTHIRIFREEALADGFTGSHARTASDYGSLMAGIMLLVEFAQEAGALFPPEAVEFEERAKSALRELMARQGDAQGEEDEVRTFLRLLQSALINGRCYVADRNNMGPPNEQPHRWGWREIPGVDGAPPTVRPGVERRIGWTDGVSLWLDGEAAYAAAQAYAREQGSAIDVSKGTLWKRIYERGFLIKTTAKGDAKQPRLAVKQWIGGASIWVYCLSAKVFESEEL